MPKFDITPIYPRPPEAGIRQSIMLFFRIADCFAPGTKVFASLLISALNAKGVTTAEAMWALHDLSELKAISPFNIHEHKGLEMVECRAPSGVEMSDGVLHIDTKENMSWTWAFFTFDHKKIAAIRAKFESEETKQSALTHRESCIVDAIGRAELAADQVADKTGFPNNSSFRATLSNMVKRNILKKGTNGYRVT